MGINSAGAGGSGNGELHPCSSLHGYGGGYGGGGVPAETAGTPRG